MTPMFLVIIIVASLGTGLSFLLFRRADHLEVSIGGIWPSLILFHVGLGLLGMGFDFRSAFSVNPPPSPIPQHLMAFLAQSSANLVVCLLALGVMASFTFILGRRGTRTQLGAMRSKLVGKALVLVPTAMLVVLGAVLIGFAVGAIPWIAGWNPAPQGQTAQEIASTARRFWFWFNLTEVVSLAGVALSALTLLICSVGILSVKRRPPGSGIDIGIGPVD